VEIVASLTGVDYDHLPELVQDVYLNRGQKLSGNGEAVQKVVRLAKEFGCAIATPAQTRQMLGLSATPSTY